MGRIADLLKFRRSKAAGDTNNLSSTEVDGNFDVVAEALENPQALRYVILPSSDAPENLKAAIEVRKDRLNPNTSAAYFAPTEDNGMRLFLGADGRPFGTLNLKYVNSIESMPSFNTAAYLTVGSLNGSHTIERSGANTIYNASGPGASHRFYTSDTYNNYDQNKLSMDVNWRGVRFPVYTTPQRDELTLEAGDAGRMIYNKTTGKVNMHDGTGWLAFTTEPA